MKEGSMPNKSHVSNRQQRDYDTMNDACPSMPQPAAHANELRTLSGARMTRRDTDRKAKFSKDASIDSNNKTWFAVLRGKHLSAVGHTASDKRTPSCAAVAALDVIRQPCVSLWCDRLQLAEESCQNCALAGSHLRDIPIDGIRRSRCHPAAVCPSMRRLAAAR